MSHCAQYCARKSAKLLMPQQSGSAIKPGGRSSLLRRSSPSGVLLRGCRSSLSADSPIEAARKGSSSSRTRTARGGPESTEKVRLGLPRWLPVRNRGEEMVLVSKAALSGIVFLLMTMGISEPRSTVVPSANFNKGLLAVEDRNDVKKLQETLRDNGHYRGGVDGILGLRTRASIRAYQTAENLPVTGELDADTAGKLGVRPQGYENTRYEAAQGKPSAGVKWDRGSRRTSNTLRNTVKRSNLALPPAQRGSDSKEDLWNP